MSLNQLISKAKKPWLNIRINDLIVDGTLTVPVPIPPVGSVPVSSLGSSGTSGVVFDNGTTVNTTSTPSGLTSLGATTINAVHGNYTGLVDALDLEASNNLIVANNTATGTLNVSSNAAVGGTLSTGTLNVSNNATVSNNLIVNNNIDANANVDIFGDITSVRNVLVTTSLTTTGTVAANDITDYGDLNVSGLSTLNDLVVGGIFSGIVSESDISPGTNGQVLTTSGGVSSWATVSGIGNLYTTDGTLTGNRIVDCGTNNFSVTNASDFNIGASSIFLNNVPTLTTTEHRLLVRDNVTGIILERDVSSLPKTLIQSYTKQGTQGIMGPATATPLTFTYEAGAAGVTYSAGVFTMPPGDWKVTASINYVRQTPPDDAVIFRLAKIGPSSVVYNQIERSTVSNVITSLSIQAYVPISITSLFEFNVDCAGTGEVVFAGSIGWGNIIFEKIN